MRTIKGPAVFLSQFIGEVPPFDTLEGLAGWASGLGFRGVQVPVHDPRIFDPTRAATEPAYADQVQDMLARHGLELTELAAQRTGALLAVHPALDLAADAMAPEALRGNHAARRDWALGQMRHTIEAANRLGVRRVAVFSGALLWPYVYPWPPRAPGLREAAFDALAHIWLPILDMADQAGVDLCFELHPGQDLHDGASFDAFLDRVNQHPRAKILFDPSHMLLQHMDYLGFLDLYHPRVAAMHVKDAEFHPSPRAGVYGGFLDWIDRPGRFRSPGDGQIDFRGIFSRLTQYDYDGWAVREWECCLKHWQDGAREGARFIRDHIIRASDRTFDARLQRRSDPASIARALGPDAT